MHLWHLIVQLHAAKISAARHCSPVLKLELSAPLVRRAQDVMSVPSVAILMSDGMPALRSFTHGAGEKGGGEGGGGDGGDGGGDTGCGGGGLGGGDEGGSEGGGGDGEQCLLHT